MVFQQSTHGRWDDNEINVNSIVISVIAACMFISILRLIKHQGSKSFLEEFFWGFVAYRGINNP